MGQTCGIVDRVTFHNPDNGRSVLRVLPFNNPHRQEAVIVHQTKVFAGTGVILRRSVLIQFQCLVPVIVNEGKLAIIDPKGIFVVA